MIFSSIKPDQFFVIRQPRQSILLTQQLPEEPEALWLFLLAWSQQAEIRLALYVASPSLAERLQQVKHGDHKQREKLTNTLLKYYIRSCTRPTPFGLFAGVHRGDVTDKTELLTSERNQDKKISRLDMFYLTEIRERLTRPAVLTGNHLLYANPTLWRRDRHYHYIDAYQGANQREFRLSAVQHESYLQQLIDWCSQPLPVSALKQQFLASYPDCQEPAFDSYLQQLVDERVLFVHLPLKLTSKAPDLMFAKALHAFGAEREADVLETVIEQLRMFDQADVGDIAALQAISRHLRQLDYPVNDAKLIQTDSYIAMDVCTLDPQLLQQLTPVMCSLLHLAKDRKQALEQFSTAFTARYETARVPLLAVLDDESGISFSNETGFTSPLLAGLPIRKPKSVGQSQMFKHVFNQLEKNSEQKIIQLASSEIMAGISQELITTQLPCSFSVKFALYGDTAAPKIHYQGCTGPSAVNLLGRFCHLDQQLEQDVIRHLTEEQQLMPDVILAEIVHLPDGRPGNVIARPTLRPYEIVVLADGAVSAEHQISLQDLSVYIQQGQVCLWSERLQRRIMPRLSNAHNFSQRSLGIYRFLSSLAQQAVRLPLFSWPEDMLLLPFLPRVEIDQCIVSCARWRIPGLALTNLLHQRLANIDSWAEFAAKYQLPTEVCYSVGDNVLTINLHNISQLRLLVAETTGAEFVILEESLTAQYPSCVQGPDGGYAHEILWPMLNAPANPTYGVSSNATALADAQRQFAPGSEWMTCKIYCGHSSAEMILNRLAPLFLEWQSKGWCSQWFFIRYSDPDWHLRLRFNGVAANLFGQLYPSLYQSCEPMLQSGRISNLTLVNYVRETERYGGVQAIELAERWFYQESAYLLQLFPELSAQGETARFVFAMEMVDLVLTAFDFDMTDKLRWITEIRQRFADEMQETKLLRQLIGDKYRQFSTELKTFTGITPTRHSGFLAQQKGIAAIYKKLAIQQQLITPLEQVIGSLTHMLCNRLFKAYGREHEYLVYDLLRRRYLTLSSQPSAGTSTLI